MNIPKNVNPNDSFQPGILSGACVGKQKQQQQLVFSPELEITMFSSEKKMIRVPVLATRNNLRVKNAK